MPALDLLAARFYKCSMSEDDKESQEARLLPSSFMRALRPENYSDTPDRVAYMLDEATLRFQLDSITERNETHAFEIFCRKLCERTICPNLKPATGPEGGGDSKADAETIPVSHEVSRLWYSADANAGQERWAFAFSAKEAWSEKVRNDVQGIVETDRGYSKIFFATSRAARAKDRARIEDELTATHGVQVTILDRSWIVKEIVENDRKDLAFNYLNVGQVVDDPLRLGPTDYSRKRQLQALEDGFKNSDAYVGMETQQVTEALVAAKLSRNMELPAVETEGRFARAVRLAEAEGTERQIFEAKYERLWTAFWWFDDFSLLNASYDEFAESALPTEHAANIEFVCNLTQCLVNAVVHGHLTAAEARLPERMGQLREALERMVAQKDRPNNSLEARTMLLMLHVNEALLDGRPGRLESIWREFSEVVQAAKGLGEFDADRLVNLIEIVGSIAKADAAYNSLVEEVAEFVTERKGEAEGALLLLKRASQLDFDQRFDMIRMLGKAARKLTKLEYSEQLLETLQRLSIAYRSAGLFWAARASCLFACSTIIMQSEPESELRVDIVPTLKLWAWVSFELRHIPEFLMAIQLLNGCLASMPLTDESKERVREDLQDLDRALASQLVALDEENLRLVATLPDILEALRLLMARTALLYALGHESVLRADGSLPQEERDESIRDLLTRLGNAGLPHRGIGALILNDDGQRVFHTSIIGMDLFVRSMGTETSILAAEAILGSLEAFFATALDMRIMPHTERFDITIEEVGGLEKPEFTVDTARMTGVVRWPSSLFVTGYETQALAGDSIFELVAYVLSATCMIPDVRQAFEQLFKDELVHDRIAMILPIGNSHHRLLNNFVTRLSEWDRLKPKAYELLPTRPDLKFEPSEQGVDDDGPPVGPEHVGRGITVKSHRALKIRSVINPHLWDEAGWTATLYISALPPHDDAPPIMALAFTNGVAAKQIFDNWRERFGANDENEEIYISIIRNVSKKNPFFYRVMVASNIREDDGSPSHSNFIIASRSLTMTPTSDENLNRFLASYQRAGFYGLMPARLTPGQQPEVFHSHAIGKTKLTVRNAADVAEGDLDFMALGPKHGEEEP